MKYLLIVRHAKSSWSDPYLDDFERPLNKRGKNDAPEMGVRLSKKKIFPDLMLSSPAKRALVTCEKIAKEVDYTSGAIETNEDLYHASSQDILHIISQLDDLWQTVAIFGHNPGLTVFANKLNGTGIDNIPTTGMVYSELEIDSWRDAGFGSGTMRYFDFPKNR